MDALWRIELLGWLRATPRDRATVACQVVTRFRTQKVGALLAYLAYSRHRSHPRDELVELFWPECDRDTGRHRLRTALSSLRHPLEPPGIPPGAVILADRASVQLNPAAVTSDVTQFEAALQAASRASSGTERMQRLIEAVELYRGELLPGSFEAWVLPERQRLAEAFLQAGGQLSADLEQAGDLPGALQWARRAVSADPLREEAHRELMRLLAGAGEPDAALRQYRELEGLLAVELDATPESETQALASSLRSPTGEGRRKAREGGGVRGARDGSSYGERSEPLGLAPVFRLPAPASLPTGTVTVLLTEIANAAALRRRAGTALTATLDAYRELLRPLFRGHGGHEVGVTEETVQVAFGRASDALAAAVAAQRALAAHAWPADIEAPCTRMALHMGEIEPGEEVQRSPALAHAARLLRATHGGQILLSEGAAALLQQEADPGRRLVDLGLYRLGDGAPPERLFQACDPEMGPQPFPPPNAPPGQVGNLPLPLTRFFGREVEIAGLRDLLLGKKDAPRLVTLTGPGGGGKTRLALELAARLRGPFQGGVWFVPLVDVADPRLIPDKALDALRLPRSPYIEPLEQVVATLARQPSLLLLDNFEHLLPEGAAIVGTLLQRVATLTVLVTSRRRLDLPGEREFPVPPLPTPQGPYTPEQVCGCDSVQLFLDRAQAVRPDFQVTAGNAAAVAGVCARLEGLPLALELAAARAWVLTPSQMLARLSQRFELLTSRQRRGDGHHRSLRAALDWSYRLLSPELQRFFARLSVFRGGWTPAGAEAICEEPQALEYLEQLRDCSLVLAALEPGSPTGAHPAQEVGRGGEEMRYRLLETLREYGAEQRTPEEWPALARRHAQYYLALAEAAAQEQEGPEQAPWFERLEKEHDNLRAALAWCQAAEDSAEAGLRLAAALGGFWQVRGYWSEGRERLACLLALTGAAARTAARAQALNAAGLLAWRQSDLEAARALREESLAICQELGDRLGIARSLSGLGLVARDQGDYASARRLFEEALAINRALGNRREQARSLHYRGYVPVAEGDHASAKTFFEEALAIDRETGPQGGASFRALGELALMQGDYAAARQIFEKALRTAQVLKYKLDIARCLKGLGDVADGQEDCETAQALYVESLTIYGELGYKPGIAWLLQAFAALAAARGQAERAARLLGAADPLIETIGARFEPALWPSHVRDMSAVRAALGKEAFAAAWAAGRAMTLEQVIAQALEALQSANTEVVP